MVQSFSNFDFILGEIMLFDKPLDWTSFDVVNHVRYSLCKKMGIKKLKVGHAGTLDPKATGLVVLCTGKATKKIESIQAAYKEYTATIKLGATTPSFDLETEEDKTWPTAHITLEKITESLMHFEGEIDQVPPVFSAIKIKGKRAFDYARKGEELEMKSRKVIIHSIEVENFELPYLTIQVKCGKGTYVRSLARDIGERLGSGSYLIALRRTRIGEYDVKDALDMEKFSELIK